VDDRIALRTVEALEQVLRIAAGTRRRRSFGESVHRTGESMPTL
jgi:hypothetical protein